MKLKLTLNNKVYHANMKDIPLVKQILNMCPFDLKYQRSQENEYYIVLPKQTDTKGNKFESTPTRRPSQARCRAVRRDAP